MVWMRPLVRNWVQFERWEGEISALGFSSDSLFTYCVIDTASSRHSKKFSDNFESWAALICHPAQKVSPKVTGVPLILDTPRATTFFLREWYVCPWQAARPSRVQAEQKWEEATLGKLPQSKNYKFTRAKMIHLASFYRIKPLSFLAHELALRTPNYGLNLREKRTDLRGWANHSEKRKRTAIDS